MPRGNRKLTPLSSCYGAFIRAIDELDVPLDTVPDLDAHDNKIIEKLAPMFGETRQNLGWLSADMQKLLKSPWMHDFPNATATNLFKGGEDESEGIGSGHPDHGRRLLFCGNARAGTGRQNAP